MVEGQRSERMLAVFSGLRKCALVSEGRRREERDGKMRRGGDVESVEGGRW